MRRPTRSASSDQPARPARRSRASRRSRRAGDEAIREQTSAAAGSNGGPGRAGEADRLAGYRLVRRIASGDRAEVYLAASVSPPREASAQQEGAAQEARATAAPRLVALRVYEADADPVVITTEVEAMALVDALPALHDLATLADGRTCVVVERIAGPSLASLAVTGGLGAGEAVTVLAPIAVALGQLERHGFAHTRLAMSDVLFDESGRPRLIGTGALRRLDEADAGPADRTARLREMYEAFGRLVDEVAAMTRPPGALDPVRGLVAELVVARPFRARAEEIERMVFAIAAPARVSALPTLGLLSGGMHRMGEPPVVGSTGAVPGPVAATRSRGSTDPEELHDDSPLVGRLPRALSAFGSLVSETLPIRGADGEPRSERAGPLGRLRAFIVGRKPVVLVGGLAGAAALVLALTLVPPGGDSGGAAAEHGGGAAAEGPGASREPSGAASDEPAGHSRAGAEVSDADATAAIVALLEKREGCFARLEFACLDDVVQAGSGAEASDRAELAAAQVGDGDEAGTPPSGYRLDGVRVTGRMGEAWLAEVPYEDGERQPASVLVMRSEAGWRLREIFG